jgi:hypothetical protein
MADQRDGETVPFECPCGSVHEFPAVRHTVRGPRPAVLADLLRRRPRPKVTVPGGTWRVPRVWVAAHGLKADELPALAERYGWEKIADAAAGTENGNGR